ncbi:MAG: polyprenyl diphosphate synthase [Desulfohalobiaceae bacterium]
MPQSNQSPLKHLAIIMDGNGRWAKKRDLPRSAGHQAGTEAARAVVTAARKRAIPYLTLYAFSRENWSRPREEVNFLFDLLVRFLKQEQKTLLEQSIRLNILGDLQELPWSVRQAVKHVCGQTSQCQEMVLNLALNYSGREDILQACRHLISEGISAQEVSHELLKSRLYTRDQPDPDLIIRTSGECRLSNYLIYQAAYSEFYFTQTLWPDFAEEDLDLALEEYRRRQRRFGGLSEHGE